MPIHVAISKLDEIGYAGWWAELRLNVRAGIYDDFLCQDRGVFWDAFSAIVLTWNLREEDGKPLRLPRDGLGPRDLPVDILSWLVLRYTELMADSRMIAPATASPRRGVVLAWATRQPTNRARTAGLRSRPRA